MRAICVMNRLTCPKMTANVQHLSPKTAICQKWNNSDAVNLAELTKTDIFIRNLFKIAPPTQKYLVFEFFNNTFFVIMKYCPIFCEKITKIKPSYCSLIWPLWIFPKLTHNGNIRGFLLISCFAQLSKANFFSRFFYRF